MSSYRLTRRADADLEDITDYLTEHSPSAVNRVLSALKRAFRFLADHPDAGSLRDELKPNLRSFTPRKPAHGYVVYFRRHRVGIQIAAVLHGSRDVETELLGRRSMRRLMPIASKRDV